MCTALHLHVAFYIPQDIVKFFKVSGGHPIFRPLLLCFLLFLVFPPLFLDQTDVVFNNGNLLFLTNTLEKRLFVLSKVLDKIKTSPLSDCLQRAAK